MRGPCARHGSVSVRVDQRRRVVTVQEWRHDMTVALVWMVFTAVVIGLAVAADLGGWLA